MNKSVSGRRKIRWYCVHFWIGILFGWMIAVSALSGRWNANQFYQSDKVYDITFDSRMADFEGAPYDVAAGKYVIQQEDVRFCYTLTQDYYNWNYIYLTLSELNTEKLDATMEFYLDGVLQNTRQVELTEGKNCLEANGVVYNQMQLHFVAQKDKSFTITGLQFRSNPAYLTFESVSAGIALAAMAYWLLVYFVCRSMKGRRTFDWYQGVEYLQAGFIQVGNVLLMLTKGMSDIKRRRIRCCNFMMMILLMSTLENLCTLHGRPYYGITMLLMVIGIAVCSVLAIEKPLHKVNWRNPLVASWFALWTLAIISDFFVNKRYQYQGWIMIFVVGFFFFCWGNMEKPETLLWDLIRGGEFAFLATTIFIYFCRPIIGEARYSGFFRNPNIEAAFSSAAVILFLIELDRRIVAKKMGIHGYLYLVGLIVALDRTIRSDGRAGQLAAIGAIAIFSLYHLFYGRRNKTLLMGVKVVFAGLLLAIPILIADDWIFHNLPQKLGTTVVYPMDAVYQVSDAKWRIFSDRNLVYAEEMDEHLQQDEANEEEIEEEENENLEEITSGLEARRSLKMLSGGSLVNNLEAYSSGRTLYYLAYIRQMNLLGHYYHARNWGDYIYPHNGLLEIMYRYGIFAGIPYCAMLIYVLWYSMKYARKHSEGKTGCRLYPLLITVGAFGNLLFENAEKPFVWMIWILLYLGMGILFSGEEDEIEGRKARYENRKKIQ